MVRLESGLRLRLDSYLLLFIVSVRHGIGPCEVLETNKSQCVFFVTKCEDDSHEILQFVSV